jgi:hypothetical protein
MKLKYLVIHCTDTPEGREVSSAEIKQWHQGPHTNPDKTVHYMGKDYSAISALPPDKIGGISVYKLQGNGWRQVGYRDMIHLNGWVENLVPYNDDDNVDPWEITNGASEINAVTHHVVYVGGADKKLKAKDTRTPEQHKALEEYVKKQIALHPTIQVAGHNQFDPRPCPSFSVVQWAIAKGIPKENIYPGEMKVTPEESKL